MAVFRLGYERWVHARDETPLSELYRVQRSELREVVAES